MANQFIYGRNPVAEAERGRRAVRRIWRAPETPPEELERLCGSPDHQGVVAEVDPYPYADPLALLEPPGGLLVALDQVQDPRNLGAIARSAEVAGATGLVVPERRAAVVTPAACKASAGAVEHLQVARARHLALGGGPDGAARPCAGRGGEGPAAARHGGLRRHAGAAAARPHRLPQRLRRGDRAAL